MSRRLPPLSLRPLCLSLASSWSTLTQIFLVSSVHLNRTPLVRRKTNRCRTASEGEAGSQKMVAHLAGRLPLTMGQFNSIRGPWG